MQLAPEIRVQGSNGVNAITENTDGVMIFGRKRVPADRQFRLVGELGEQSGLAVAGRGTNHLDLFVDSRQHRFENSTPAHDQIALSGYQGLGYKW